MKLSCVCLLSLISRILVGSVSISTLSIVSEAPVVPAASAATLATPASLPEIDRAIANGEMEKAISLLDSQLVQARKDKDVFLEAKLLSQLQFAHYCKGGLRRSLVIGQNLSDVLEKISKRGISDPRIASTIADNTILYMYTEIERGDTNYLKDRINDFLKDINKATNLKSKAKFHLGLAYTYSLNGNKKASDKNFNEFRRIYPNISNLDAVEDIQLIFAYIKFIKEQNNNSKEYRNGIELIEEVKRQYAARIPMIVPFSQINITSLYSTGGVYNISSSILASHLPHIDRIPAYFRFITWNILGDNAFAQQDYKLAKKYYKLLGNELYSQIKKEGSDNAPSRMFYNFQAKEIKANYFQNGSLSKSEILSIIGRSSGMNTFSPKDSQKLIDGLVGDNLLVQDIFIRQNSPWEAFMISEFNRTQLTKTTLKMEFSTQFDQYITSDIETGKIPNHPFKDSMFPNTKGQLLLAFQLQNTLIMSRKYGDENRTKMIRGNAQSTIIEYSYNFTKTGQPKEIYVYILKPDKGVRTAKLIVRCINLDPGSISSTCKAHAPNIPNLPSSWRSEQASIAKLGFEKYIKRNLDNVRNCRRGEISRQDGCNSQAGVDPKTTYKSLQALHQLLIEPIADLLPTNPDERVIFIPQGQLFSVPFAALQDGRGKYLIEKHTVSIAPSLILLDRATKLYLDDAHGKAKDVVVVGNPTMPQGLSSLPAAETEALTIAQLYGVKPLIGNNASKEALLRQFGEARVIHLATHGLINEKDTLDNSSIALAPTPTNPNGLLMAKELPRTNAELVILSACNSGNGEVSTDGVAGFATQLILAGNPSQVVSLWGVDDSASSQIMIDFHRELRRGQSKTHALRDAMLKALSTNQYADPFYWAAFTLVGDTN
jgi:CHAT domain-containing protein/tetratricopeptide (TPR) repeat protein